jgi:hypothetical protein
MVGRVTRPAAKRTLKAGIGAYRRTREGVGHLVEESRAEMDRHPEPAAGRRGARRGRADSPRAPA